MRLCIKALFILFTDIIFDRMIACKRRPSLHISNTGECTVGMCIIYKQSLCSVISRSKKSLTQTRVTIRKFQFWSIVTIIPTQGYSSRHSICINAEEIIHKIFGTAITKINCIATYTMTFQTIGIFSIEYYFLVT